MNGQLVESAQCTQCTEMVPKIDIHDHILNCRAHRSKERQSCPSCQNDFEQGYCKRCDQKQRNIIEKKLCPICEQYVDDLSLHCQTCQSEEEKDTSGFETPRAQTPIQINKIHFEEKPSFIYKQCILCSEKIIESDLEKHLLTCSSMDDTHTNSEETRNSTYENSISSKRSISSTRERTKECPLCSQSINEFDFTTHLNTCSNEDSISSMDTQVTILPSDSVFPSIAPIPPMKKEKQCALCSQLFDEVQFEDHIQSCSIEQSNHPSTIKSMPSMKECILCSQMIIENDYIHHVSNCSSDQPSHSISQKNENVMKTSFASNSEEKKECILCFQLIDASDYIHHVTYCSSDSIHPSSTNALPDSTSSVTKDCILCFKPIEEKDYINHVTHCLSTSTGSPSTNNNPFGQINSTREMNEHDAASCKNNITKKDCILCFQAIDLSEYESHVLACIAKEDNQTRNSTLKCFTCNRLKKDNEDLFYMISCDQQHHYCWLCIQQSMEEFFRQRIIPVCQLKKCDYQLSRHDICSIPLERRLSDRLLQLVQGKQRPFCSKCHFYVEINDKESFDDHFEMCTEMIPCEYCQMPYPFEQLDKHVKQCRNEAMSLNEKLIDFILPRTRYPFSKEQLRIFIQQRSQNRSLPTDPLSIVQALAVFGATFPCEIPTRDCEICMEPCPYENIFVFDCADGHKLCYTCYYQSCQSKMNNGEILTCALCPHPLRDGELNQLRISPDQLQVIRNYQMKKTFDLYSSRTRGIIKCPKQNCTWVAEAADPNERFAVRCPVCDHQFCSLCNQEYHYRTTCQQLPQITQRWFFCENERNRYLTMRAQQDATYNAQLNEYTRKRNDNENRNRDLRRRYEELMDDEKYKAQNCRLCPSCKRVVQRLEGCDSMICGQDAHGGNVQSGCGAKFNWAQATPYHATATKQPKQTIADLPKPSSPVVHHNGVKCDRCKKDVNGIRFDCVHCPALTFCEKCEGEATLTHLRENQAAAQQQHVFKLIMTPDEEAFAFQ